MSIRFRCPHCDKLLAAGMHKGGAPMNCPACDRPVTPRTDVRLRDDLPRAWWVDAPAPAKRTPPLPRGTLSIAHSFTRLHALILTGGVVAALLVIGGALALLPARAPKGTPRPPEQMAQASGMDDKSEPASEVYPDPKPAPEVKPDEMSKPGKPPVIEDTKEESVAPPPLPPPSVEAEVPKAPAPPAEAIVKPTPSGKLVIKHRREVSEDELRRQIEKAPEVSLDRGNDRTEARRAVMLARAAAREGKSFEIAPRLMKQRPDLAGLPMRMGDECHLGAEASDHLQGGSLALRSQLFEATRNSARTPTGDPRPDSKKLHDALSSDEQHNKWLQPEAIPALQQLLMAENESIREVLVDQLARIDDKQASIALAQRALFDLHPRVRQSALAALAKRPAAEYRQVLLDGFRHPWPAVADHAAEALVALGLREVVPVLLSFLDQPDPAAPHKKPGQDVAVVREMVRVNHLHNCLLCHAPSLNENDKVRGFVPQPDQPLPPAFTREYYANRRPGIFVRADVTYLRQDFSVPLLVKHPGKWPAAQRYDFLVRERPATAAEVQAARAAESNGPSEHQKALFFALRELTGTDPGPSVEDWKRLFLPGVQVTRVGGGLTSMNGVAVDERGRVWVSAAGEILRAEPDAELVSWRKDLDGCKGLAVDHAGRLIICQAGKGRLLALEGTKQDAVTLADRYKGLPLHAPTHLVVDRQGGAYFTDAAVRMPNGDIAAPGAVYYLSPRGTLTRLSIPLPAPAGIALSPDEKTLYLTAGTMDVMAYPLEGVGIPGKGRLLGKLDTRGGAPIRAAGGLAVDRRGNLYVANPALHAVQVLNSEGVKLGLIALPDPPLACAIGGPEGKTLFVATHHALFKVQLDAADPDLANKDI